VHVRLKEGATGKRSHLQGTRRVEQARVGAAALNGPTTQEGPRHRGKKEESILGICLSDECLHSNLPEIRGAFGIFCIDCNETKAASPEREELRGAVRGHEVGFRTLGQQQAGVRILQEEPGRGRRAEDGNKLTD